MSQTEYSVAIVGATGAVGEVLLEILAERQFPVKELYPLASAQSETDYVMFNNKRKAVLNLDSFDFAKADYAFFVATNDVSELYAPIATEKNCIVIDNSSRYRKDPDVPLVIPEVNAEVLAKPLTKNLIANPNCSTIQMLVALNAIHDAVTIRRIDVATYQSVSGAGNKAIQELASQTAALLSGQEAGVEILPQQIAFNILPHIGDLQDDGYTTEEMKMHDETRKIWQDNHIVVNATAVRVPVFYGHSEAIHIETENNITIDEATDLLRNTSGVEFLEQGEYPTAITHAASNDNVFVGRLRKSLGRDNGLNLWVVADNVKKGAALNAVQIAELLVKRSQVLH